MHYLQKENRDLEDNFALTKIENNLQIKDCLNADLMINQKDKELDFVKSIYALIFRFNDLVNVGKKMNESQMMQLSYDLYENFKGDTLEDVTLFFKMARQGEFGDFYRLDSTVVESWLPKYFEVKNEAREREIINERNIRERAENDAVASYVPDDVAKEKLKELSARLKGAGKRTTEINKENPLFNYQAYLDSLPEKARQMSDKMLKTMLDNTTKSSHPEVYEILENEFEDRLAKFVADDTVNENKKLAKKMK